MHLFKQLIWNEPQPETELKYLYHVYKGEHSNDLVQVRFKYHKCIYSHTHMSCQVLLVVAKVVAMWLLCS